MNRLGNWLNQRQLRVLDEAYTGALEVKALEEKYFQGGKIAYSPQLSKTVYEYVKGLRDRQLLRIRSNLTQFRVSSFLSNQNSIIQVRIANGFDANGTPPSPEAEMLSKLDYIDGVIAKYRDSEDDLELTMAISQIEPDPDKDQTPKIVERERKEAKKSRSLAELTPNSVIPPGLGAPTRSERERLNPLRSAFNQIGREFNPNEQQILQEVRLRRVQDRVALRWAIILILVPLLFHFVTKITVLDPILGSYSERNPTQIELSREIQQNFLAEFVEVKESLEVRQLLGEKIDETRKEEVLQETAVELWRASRNEALNGLKNVIADGIALMIFTGIVYFNRRQLTVLRSVLNRTFLGLSDPAKVFLFILVTDMFVGFHSAEGWEVILEGIARHFGLPESKAAINGFIATVPVVADSVIKFWIFSYLTRYSPSASAIYERMNT